MNYFRTSLYLAAMTALFMGAGFLLAGSSGMLFAFFAALAMNLFAYWQSDKLVLRMQGAKRLSQEQAPELYNMTAALARNASLPMPALYLIAQAQPNAFATGRSPDHAAVAVSQGLLDQLNQEEIAGVIAHELAHIKNRDTLIMTIAATFAGALSMLAQFAQFSLLFGGNRDENRHPFGMIAVVLAMLLAPLAALLVQTAISRTREFAADKMGAIIAQNPQALASALEKIERSVQRTRNHRAEQSPGSAHVFIISPFSAQNMQSLFSTHPSTKARIAALNALEQSMDFTAKPLRAAEQKSFSATERSSRRGRSPWNR